MNIQHTVIVTERLLLKIGFIRTMGTGDCIPAATTFPSADLQITQDFLLCSCTSSTFYRQMEVKASVLRSCGVKDKSFDKDLQGTGTEYNNGLQQTSLFTSQSFELLFEDKPDRSYNICSNCRLIQSSTGEAVLNTSEADQ